MKSPCIAACKNNGSICNGCHRTVGEIANWQHKSNIERQHIMAELSGKSSTHSCPLCGQHATCDLSKGKSTCWCFELEERDISQLDDLQHCLCRSCLTKLTII